MCMGQCGIQIDVVDGKPRRIRPNTAAPTSATGICARGVSGAYNAWLNPDAILKPSVRKPLLDWHEGKSDWAATKQQLTQSRGRVEDLVEVPWSTALDIVARKLQQLDGEGARNRLSFLFGAWGPVAQMRMGVPINRFADTFGGSVTTFDNPYCTYPRFLGHALTWGHGHQAHVPCIDYGEAQAVLVVRRNVVGAGIVGESWRFMEAIDKKAKVVVMSPVFDETASFADVWLPVKPGTDLPIILAFIRYTLEGGYYVAEYVRRLTNGTILIKPDGLPLLPDDVDWGSYGVDAPKSFTYLGWNEAAGRPVSDTEFQTTALFGAFPVQTKQGPVIAKTAMTVLKEQITANLDALARMHGTADYLEAAAKEAGVEAAKLRQAAEIVAKHRAVAPIGWHDPRYSHSPQLWRAMGILMGLLGRIEAPGGVFLLSHLIMPYSDMYTKVLEYGRKDQPYKTIRGLTFTEYMAANGTGLYTVPLSPPLPGPAERGAPPVAGLMEGWAEAYEHDQKALYLWDSVQAIGEPGAEIPQVLFITGSNPVPQIGNSRAVEEIFRKLDMVVVHDVQFSDTAAFADVVLPDLPYLERLDLPLPGPFSPFPAVTVRFPWFYEEYKQRLAAGEKPGELDRAFRSRDGRTAFEILLGVAKRLQAVGVKARDNTDWGQNMPLGMLVEGDIFPITNLERFINGVLRRVRLAGDDGTVKPLNLDALYQAGGYLLLEPTGKTMPILDDAWSQALGREVRAQVHVYRPTTYHKEDEQRLWRSVHYNSPIAQGKVPLPTPSGKVELYSINLAHDASRVFGSLEVDPSTVDGTSGAVDPLFSPVPLYGGMARPDYLWAHGAPSADVAINGLVAPQPPFRLSLVYRHGPYTQTHSATQNNLLLNAVTPDELLMAWLHPETARGLGVGEGDWVELRPAAPKVMAQLKAAGAGEEPRGRLKVHVTKMARQGIIAVYHNWLVPRGRLRVKAQRLETVRQGLSDDNYLGPMLISRLGGAGAMGNTVVEVKKI
jgi:anaerobic selenocysteine-containing dehydrogenase